MSIAIRRRIWIMQTSQGGNERLKNQINFDVSLMATRRMGDIAKSPEP